MSNFATQTKKIMKKYGLLLILGIIMLEFSKLIENPTDNLEVILNSMQIDLEKRRKEFENCKTELNINAREKYESALEEFEHEIKRKLSERAKRSIDKKNSNSKKTLKLKPADIKDKKIIMESKLK